MHVLEAAMSLLGTNCVLVEVRGSFIYQLGILKHRLVQQNAK